MRIRYLFVALVVAVAALLLLPAPQPEAVQEPDRAPRAQPPSLEGRVLVYVNGELRASAPMNSFLRPVSTMLAIAFFPTSSFRSASVNCYTEAPSTYNTYISAGSRTLTLRYGADTSGSSLWGQRESISALVLVLDTAGSKWTEIVLSCTPSVTWNETGLLVVVSGSVAPSITEPKTVKTLKVVRPTLMTYISGYATYSVVRIAEDTIDPPVTVNPGDTLTVVYLFYFKADQIFTANWGYAFFAWIHNTGPAKVALTATDGSTVYLDPYAPGYDSPANNAPVNSYIVVGNGSATFSRTAYRVASEVARAEPSVQVYGGGVSLSYAFTFPKDTAVTELAVYVRMRDGKDVMVFYYALPQPVVAKANVPFTVTFRLNLPWEDRV